MARGGTRHLVLSGGEPTLHPQLADLIRFAASLGTFDTIEMQTQRGEVRRPGVRPRRSSRRG